MRLDETARSRRPRWRRVPALVALAGLLVAGGAVQAGDAQARAVASSPTRSLQLRLSAQDLGLKESVSSSSLARAALKRSSRALGLPSVKGLRLARHLTAPKAPDGGIVVHTLRFQQTSGGHRVLWSQIDVTVGAGEVRSIDATIVHVKSGRPAVRSKVSASRAVTIARRTVSGPEAASRAHLVTFAGNPAKGRAPRLAYVVETHQAQTPEDAPDGLCIVVDAVTGRVLTTWKGDATPDLSEAASAVPASARTARARTATTRAPAFGFLTYVFDGHGPNLPPPYAGIQLGSLYGGWFASGSPFNRSSWNTTPFFSPQAVQQFQLTGAMYHIRDVISEMCFRRGFCGFMGSAQPDGSWMPYYVTIDADVSTRYTGAPAYRVVLSRSDLSQWQEDVIAHEYGHHVIRVFGGESNGSRFAAETGEALADMFAYDYDGADTTLGEDGPAGPNTASPLENWGTHSIGGQPFGMQNYSCLATDHHFNSTILTHAYYRFVQLVGPEIAGFLLYRVPGLLGPDRTFAGVANAFVSVAQAYYPGTPSVVAGARQAFVTEAHANDTSVFATCPANSPA